MRYAIIISILLTACNHADFKHSAADTTRTSALYLLPNGTVNGSVVFRITHDSLSIDTSKKNKPKLSWMRDTIYYLPNAVPLFDSVRHPIIDSITKQQKTELTWLQTNKENVLKDFNKIYKN